MKYGITLNQGKLQAIEMPKAPVYPSANSDMISNGRCWDRYEKELTAYEEAVKKVKAEAIDFRPEDYHFNDKSYQHGYGKLVFLFDRLNSFDVFEFKERIKEGEIYQCPEGFEIKIEEKRKRVGASNTIVEYAKLVPKEQKKQTTEDLLKESQIIMSEIIQVFNGSYQLDKRYEKLLDLTDRIEAHLYPKT